MRVTKPPSSRHWSRLTSDRGHRQSGLRSDLDEGVTKPPSSRHWSRLTSDRGHRQSGLRSERTLRVFERAGIQRITQPDGRHFSKELRAKVKAAVFSLKKSGPSPVKIAEALSQMTVGRYLRDESPKLTPIRPVGRGERYTPGLLMTRPNPCHALRESSSIAVLRLKRLQMSGTMPPNLRRQVYSPKLVVLRVNDTKRDRQRRRVPACEFERNRY